MWWKLGGPVVLTAALVFSVIPIRTRPVAYDPLNEPPPGRGTFGDLLGNMHLTPFTGLLILAILGAASFVAFKVLRGQW